MKKRLNTAEARRILSKAPFQVSFWLCTNEQLRSLEELSVALKKASDDVFRYHVNRDKNDFEAWIRETIKDKELAREISRIKTRATLIRKLDERIAELRKLVKKGFAGRKKKRFNAVRSKKNKRKKPLRRKKTKKALKKRRSKIRKRYSKKQKKRRKAAKKAAKRR